MAVGTSQTARVDGAHRYPCERCPLREPLTGNPNLVVPITQAQVADRLGLSLVHTNKTLRKLMDRRLIAWRDGGFEVLDF